MIAKNLKIRVAFDTNVWISFLIGKKLSIIAKYYLVTGDKDLLLLNPFETTKILTVSDFEKILIYK